MTVTNYKEFAVTWVCDPDRCSPPHAPEQEGVICALDEDDGGSDSVRTIAVKYNFKGVMRWGWFTCDGHKGADRLWHYLRDRQRAEEVGPVNEAGEYGKILLNFVADDGGSDITIRGVTFVHQEIKVRIRSDPALYNDFKGFGEF